jgi:hypothetical protein
MLRNEDPRIEEAMRVHGADCVGLRIGVRAVNIVTRELAISEDTKRLQVRLGTKQCLGDAFKALFHLEDNQLEYVDPRDDIIRVRNGIDVIELHLTPRKLRETNDVLRVSDAELFPVIKRLTGKAVNASKGVHSRGSC